MPPLSLMIKPVSGLCNMRCRYCFYADVSSHRQNASYGRMSEETLENLVRRALTYADGQCDFAFQGGEPTLAGLPFFERLMALQKRYNTRGLRIQNSIQTNAFAMTEEMAQFLARNRFLTGVSLDGTRQTHDALRPDAQGNGTYDRVLAGIDKLRQAGAEFNILCVVNGLVAREPARVFEALKPYTYLQFIACLDSFDGEKTGYSLDASRYADFLIETFRLYYQANRKGEYVSVRAFDNYIGILLGRAPEMCSMNGRCGVYYLLEADGSVYPCDFYVLDRYRMGNVNSDSFYRLAKSPVGEAFRQASYEVADACKTCRWYRLCRGGCRRDRQAQLEDGLGVSRWCEAYKRFFEACYPMMAQMAQAIEAKQNL